MPCSKPRHRAPSNGEIAEVKKSKSSLEGQEESQIWKTAKSNSFSHAQMMQYTNKHPKLLQVQIRGMGMKTRWQLGKKFPGCVPLKETDWKHQVEALWNADKVIHQQAPGISREGEQTEARFLFPLTL